MRARWVLCCVVCVDGSLMFAVARRLCARRSLKTTCSLSRIADVRVGLHGQLKQGVITWTKSCVMIVTPERSLQRRVTSLSVRPLNVSLWLRIHLLMKPWRHLAQLITSAHLQSTCSSSSSSSILSETQCKHVVLWYMFVISTVYHSILYDVGNLVWYILTCSVSNDVFTPRFEKAYAYIPRNINLLTYLLTYFSENARQ